MKRSEEIALLKNVFNERGVLISDAQLVAVLDEGLKRLRVEQHSRRMNKKKIRSETV